MKRLTDNELDALEAALAKATPGEWTVEMDGPDDDDSPCDVVIPEINRILHSTEWADPEDFEQDVANAEAIVAAHNALPALIAELRQLRARITPEVIGEKHRDGNWWLVWEPFCERWVQGRWRERSQMWIRPDDGYVVAPTHALPVPPAPERERMLIAMPAPARPPRLRRLAVLERGGWMIEKSMEGVMTRTVMPGIKQPWQVIIIDDRLTDLYWVQVWNKQSMVVQSSPFHTRVAAENWAREKAREMRIVKYGETRS